MKISLSLFTFIYLKYIYLKRGINFLFNHSIRKDKNKRSWRKNYIIRIATFCSLKCVYNFCFQPKYAYFIAKERLTFTKPNVKIHALFFKSPTFFDILISKKNADTFL